MTRICLFLLIAAINLSCSSENKSEKEKPNIIFIFADDQCYSTIHSLGNREITTPNLDQLAKQGMVFTHAYNMGAWNGAVCLASRAMLNTGRFVWNAHSYENRQHELVEGGEMWGQLMKKAGYDTYMTGKWHVKTAAAELFDNVVHVRPGMPKDNWNQRKIKENIDEAGSVEMKNRAGYLPAGYNRPLSTSDTTWMPWKKEFGGYWEGGKHWSEVVADDAIGFIDSVKKSSNPFFMYLAFNSPHDPRQSPRKYVDMYPLEHLSVPESFLPEYPYNEEMGCGPLLRDEALAPFPRTGYAVKVHTQEYYAIITHMDYQIGKILKALDKSGLLENTYIFFTADHGLALGKHGLLGKQNMYDHSIRVPLIVKGPEVPKKSRSNVDVYLQDIMATTLDIAGLEKPEYIEFNSLMPFIRDERADSYYPAIYGCYELESQRMIRSGGYKLIVYPKIQKMRLYDLVNDPLEMNDISDNPDFNVIKLTLIQKLFELQKQQNDPLNLQELMLSWK